MRRRTAGVAVVVCLRLKLHMLKRDSEMKMNGGEAPFGLCILDWMKSFALV
jgi:hypothetical protein